MVSREGVSGEIGFGIGERRVKNKGRKGGEKILLVEQKK